MQDLLGDDVFNDSSKNLQDDLLPSVDFISYPESLPATADIAVSTSTSIIPSPIPPQDLNCEIDSSNNYREATTIITPMPSPIPIHDQSCGDQFCAYCVNHIHSLPLDDYENLGTPSEFGTVSNVPTPSTSSSFRTKTYKTDKGKKRLVHKDRWLTVDRKLKKNLGKEFINNKGKVIQQKKNERFVQ